MASEKDVQITEPHADSTQHKRGISTVVPEPTPKKPATRSNEQAATDYLLDQNRIGTWNHQPYRKRRYVRLNIERMMNSLFVLYVHLIQVHWSAFARAAEKFAPTANLKTTQELCAGVYLSHWIHDLYYSIRESLKKVDPVAFADKYHYEVARNADKYDHFLTMVNAAIRPTHITNTMADEVYIPMFDEKQDFSSKTPIPWTKYTINHTLFQLVHQVFEMRKLIKMTPLSDDPMGRPSWLFDWPTANEAYAWFPMEGNYNDTDIAIAYTIGVACTPKLGYADEDEWRLFEKEFNSRLALDHDFQRVTRRVHRGIAEYRVVHAEKIQIPAFAEKDKDKFKASNIGPYKLYPKTGLDQEGTSLLVEDDETTTPVETHEGYVPDSPRIYTRRTTEADADKVARVRIVDYLYYAQVIQRFEDTSRHAAFKMFNQA